MNIKLIIPIGLVFTGCVLIAFNRSGKPNLNSTAKPNPQISGAQLPFCDISRLENGKTDVKFGDKALPTGIAAEILPNGKVKVTNKTPEIVTFQSNWNKNCESTLSTKKLTNEVFLTTVVDIPANGSFDIGPTPNGSYFRRVFR
jgi:hypothetical protein